MKAVFRSLSLVLLLALVLGCPRAVFGAWDGADSLLYWMVDDSSNTIEFDYAVVYAAPTASLDGKAWTAETGYGDVGAIALPRNAEGGMGLAYDVKPGSTTGTLDILTSLGNADYSGYSFYIELLQWDDGAGLETRAGVSQIAPYDELVANHHLLTTGMGIPSNLEVWAPRTSATPEPTSGILLLIGCATLLLRRRNDRA